MLNLRINAPAEIRTRVTTVLHRPKKNKAIKFNKPALEKAGIMISSTESRRNLRGWRSWPLNYRGFFGFIIQNY